MGSCGTETMAVQPLHVGYPGEPGFMENIDACPLNCIYPHAHGNVPESI